MPVQQGENPNLFQEPWKSETRVVKLLPASRQSMTGMEQFVFDDDKAGGPWRGGGSRGGGFRRMHAGRGNDWARDLARVSGCSEEGNQGRQAEG